MFAGGVEIDVGRQTEGIFVKICVQAFPSRSDIQGAVHPTDTDAVGKPHQIHAGRQLVLDVINPVVCRKLPHSQRIVRSGESGSLNGAGKRFAVAIRIGENESAMVHIPF